MPEDSKVERIYLCLCLFPSVHYALKNARIEMSSHTMMFISCELKGKFLYKYFVGKKSIGSLCLQHLSEIFFYEDDYYVFAL